MCYKEGEVKMMEYDEIDEYDLLDGLVRRILRRYGVDPDEDENLVDAVIVRSTENFNWTFIFILSVVFYVYWSEMQKKNYEVIYAALALYGVHWLYEIGNALIRHFFGYPLWTVSNASTTYILLI